MRGWAIGEDGPVTAVEGAHEGTVLWRVPPVLDRPQVAARFPQAGGDPVGFYALPSVLALPPRHEIELTAMIGDRAAPIGSIVAERAPLTTTFEPRRQPILITTFGRTGSMLLMRLLASHPDVLVVPAAPLRAADRRLLDRGAAGAVGPRQLPARRHAPESRARASTTGRGGSASMPRRRGRCATKPCRNGSAARRWRRCAETCQERIDAVYETIAAVTGATREPFFAEKSTPRVSSVAAELYPNGRELFLVRDFRDMVCSILAFNEQRGVSGFGRAEADSDVDFVETLGGQATSLARAWERRQDRAHLVRYEELVLDPARALAGLLDHVGVDSRPDTVRAMLGQLEEDIPELREHATSDSAQSSIGRWRTDLDPGLAEACERAFGPALEQFGYERRSE